MLKKTEIDFLIEQIEIDNLYAEGQMPKSCRDICESLGNKMKEYRVSILKVRGKSKVPLLAREITLKFRNEKTEDEVLRVAAKKIKEKFGLDVIDAKIEDKTYSDMRNQVKKTKRDAMNAEQRQAEFDNQAAHNRMRHTASHSARTMAMMTPFF